MGSTQPSSALAPPSNGRSAALATLPQGNRTTLASPDRNRKAMNDRWAANYKDTLPRITSVGAYGGFPSAIGLQIAVPTDGQVAFRSGLTGFPSVGLLWTPGIEIRFNQVPGTYSTDSAYTFANLFFGRESLDGPDKIHRGLEAGLGYRWLLPDRRGVRWIAGIEAGAKWSPEHEYPDLPSVRAYWMIAAP